jgi:uncharacterized protein YndB with AHSA1/START domain
MPKFERQVEIDAPVETVWKVLTDARRWPEWLPGVDQVSSVGALRKGSTFEWVDDDRTGRGVIAEFEPQKRLEIVTQMGDDKDAHIFELRPSGGFLNLGDDECKVEYTLDTIEGGGIVGRFVAGGNPRDMMRVKKAMVAFRKLVERL